MADTLYNTLHAEGLISDESFEKVTQKPNQSLFHVHWEVKTLLYVGVLLLTTGLGLLIYENIDSIGHQVILLIIALICTGSFTYCFKNKLPFNPAKVKSPNSYFDYILLLASISMLTFVGYLQFQYHVFGTHYGLATLIPMLVLFFLAYYFDHLGILSMAIANLALWMGVSLAPSDVFEFSNYDSETTLFTYLFLGFLLIAAALATQLLNFKSHFKFSYQHYGVHVAYIAMLAGYFLFYDSPLDIIWMLGLFAFSFFMYKDSIKSKSFYFLLLMVLYSYIAASSLVVRMFIATDNESIISLILLYFIGSAIGLILLLINFNKKFNAV